MAEQLTYKMDVDELIFAQKNKEYGAYKLRKSYKGYLTLAMWIAIFIVLCVTLGPEVYSWINPPEDTSALKRKVVQITQLAEPPSIGEKKEVTPVEAPPPLKSTIKFTPPVIKPDEQVRDEYIPTVSELKDVDPGAKTAEGQQGGIDYSLIEAPPPVEETKEPEATVYTYVEEMPSFPGGDEALMKFLSSNIQYPEIAKRAGVEGRLYVQMTVSTTGRISDIQVIKGLGAGCDEEAVRVIKMMPAWKPGKQNGHAVNVRVSIPILFKLQ